MKIKEIELRGGARPLRPIGSTMDMPAQRHWKVEILLISNITLRDKQ